MNRIPGASHLAGVVVGNSIGDAKSPNGRKRRFKFRFHPHQT